MTLTRWQKADSTGWNPFDELSLLRDEVSRLFGTPLMSATKSQFFSSWAPVVDLLEDKDNLIVRAELPGLNKDDIDVSLHDGALTISGERKSEQKREEAQTYRTERFSGRFQRSIGLPVPVTADKVSASYKDGILTITLPKTEESKPKQIQVSVK
jgi:HSP20 family protein